MRHTFAVGDSVRIHTRVVEGDKERIQIFAGIVIGRKGRGTKRNIHSPPNFLRRRRRARFPVAFAADREGRSGTTGPRSSRQIKLPPHPQRQGSDGGKENNGGRLRLVD